jgi:hypothetical protein
MSIKKTLFAIILLAVFGLSSITHAQTSTGDLRLTTSPLPINLKVTPGYSTTANIKIKNDGLATENIKVSLMKFKADSLSGAPLLSERQPGDDFFDWVTFSENTFSLPVNEWKTITATFNVPTTASFDYYYAIVFTRAQDEVKQGDRQTVIVGGTATLVLLEAVVPNAKREIKVTDFSVDKNMFEFLPATFTVKLQNSGNVHVAPRGNIFISKGDDKDIAMLEVNPAQGSILPDSPREFQAQWAEGFPIYVPKQADGKAVLDANGKPMQELKWDFKDTSKLRWGKYTAKLLLVFDDGKKDVPIEAAVTFWVMPWRLIIYGIAIPLIPALGVYFFMKWRFKKLKKSLNKKK